MIWHERWRLGRAYESELAYSIRDVAYESESEGVCNAAPEIPEWNLWLSTLFNMYYLDERIVI